VRLRSARSVGVFVALAAGAACAAPAQEREATVALPPTASATAPTATATAPPAPTAAVGPAAPTGPAVGPAEVGVASWYGDRLKGHKTASGERFDPTAMTAAHRTLPLGTWVEVTRTGTNLSVRVRINDRGPMSPRFIIDLSRGAAEKLGMVRMGVANVEVRVIAAP
jgi:rare lipoprotein A